MRIIQQVNLKSPAEQKNAKTNTFLPEQENRRGDFAKCQCISANQWGVKQLRQYLRYSKMHTYIR